MTTPSTVLILGARGRLGGAVARAFSRAGWRVMGQTRPGGAFWDPSGMEAVALDPADTEALTLHARHASVVVHALNPAYTQKAWCAEAPAMLDAAIHLAQTLKATLMLPGNVYNFGATMPEVLRIDTPQAATGPMGKVRVGMEQRLKAATQEGGLQAVVVRAGDYFGSGTGSWLDQAIAKDLPKGRVTWPGSLDVATPWAYLPDLAETFVQVASRRHLLAPFSQLHFAGHTVTGQQWVDVLAGVASDEGWLPSSGSLKLNTMPWALFRLLRPVVPTFAALEEMRYLWKTSHQLDNRELCSLMGAEPRTAFEDAVRRALRDLGLTARVHAAAN